MSYFFFFNDTATTEIYTLSLHDALPISGARLLLRRQHARRRLARPAAQVRRPPPRSEEHTSELQSQSNLVCRLLLEKKKTTNYCLHSSGSSRPATSLYSLTESPLPAPRA